jgi:hypothetical protein
MKNKDVKIIAKRKNSSVTALIKADARCFNNAELSKLSEYFSEQATGLLKQCDVELTLDELKIELSKFQEAFSQYGHDVFSMPEYKTAAHFITSNFVKDKSENLKSELQARCSLGGQREKIISGNVTKPNDLLTVQLNSPMLFKYYKLQMPEAVSNFPLEKEIEVINNKTFRDALTKHPFLEDAVLSLAKHEQGTPETFLDIPHYTYRLPLEKFIDYSGATGTAKQQFKEFLKNVFDGKETIRGTVWAKDNTGQLSPYNFIFVASVFTNKQSKIGLQKNLFHSVIEKRLLKNQSGHGYITYPEHLEARLRKATGGRYSIHIRRLYDFLLRDLENKTSVIKPAALILSAIEFTRGFKELDNFTVNKTRLDEFLQKALDGINTVGIGNGEVNYSWIGNSIKFEVKNR